MTSLLRTNQKAWDAIASDVASPYLEQRGFRRVFDRFCKDLPPAAAVLDIGCGPGLPLTRALVEQGLQVEGLDFSSRMIDLARSNVPEAIFTCQSMTEMEYELQFDGIVASYSLLCLDPDRFKQTARRIVDALKVGGRCFIALNESEQDPDPLRDSYLEIAGQRMYSRDYSEGEVRNAFSPLIVTTLEREIVRTEMYGEERSIVFLLTKP